MGANPLPSISQGSWVGPRSEAISIAFSDYLGLADPRHDQPSAAKGGLVSYEADGDYEGLFLPEWHDLRER